VLALLILAILPVVHLGPANDLVMRASIPSLVILMIGACLVLIEPALASRGRMKKGVLGGLLLVGAVTPIEEFARAVMLPAWPINRQATLIGVNCGAFPAHYVGRLGSGAMSRVMRTPQRLALEPLGRESCANPAWILMDRHGLLDL